MSQDLKSYQREQVGLQPSYELSFTDLVQQLFQEPNIFLLYDRARQSTLINQMRRTLRSSSDFNSLMEYQLVCSQIARVHYDKFNRERPAYEYFISAPHNFENYIRGQVAKHLGIPLYVGLESRVPGFKHIGRGLCRGPRLIKIPEEFNGDEFKRSAEEYLKKAQGKYLQAMPEYEVVRLKANSGRYFSLVNQLKKNWFRPSYVVNASRCWRSMNQRAVGLRDVRKPFVVFFPHYQPERTSLPEGYGFTQQALAVMALREALPDDVTVVIKEHPSTFTNQCLPFVRWPRFYKQIVDIPGVQWVNIDEDNFDLIDGAIATATLSGTSATESMLRGVPTVLFGISKWPSLDGQHSYESLDRLKSFLQSVRAGRYVKEQLMGKVHSSILETDRRYAIPSEISKDRSALHTLILRDVQIQRQL